MRKALFKKLRERAAARLKSNAGETLAEVLISMLIAALALTMLASVISSTARVINRSKEKMNEYYAASDALAKRSGGGLTSVSNGDLGITIYITTPSEDKEKIGLKAGVTYVYSGLQYELSGGKPITAYWVSSVTTGGSTEPEPDPDPDGGPGGDTP